MVVATGHLLVAMLGLYMGTTLAAPIDYSMALMNSLRFYEAQQSGRLSRNNGVSWRDDAWTSTSTPDKGDLSGGYFDGKDYIQYTLPLAFAMTQLAWGIIEFPAGYRAAGQTDNARAAVRRGLEWLIKAHYSPHELVVQVGNAGEQAAVFSAPEQDVTLHRTYIVNEKNPGSDVAAAAAAALAAGHMLFRAEDKDFATTCMDHAKDLFWFAQGFPGRYSDNMPREQLMTYNSSSYADDLFWASVWLFRATRDAVYVNQTMQLFPEARKAARSNLVWNWDNTFWGGLLLWRVTWGGDTIDGTDHTSMDADLDLFFSNWFQGNDTLKVKVNEEGYSCVDTGESNGVTANAAFFAVLAAKIPDPSFSNQLVCWARDMISYLLGQNTQGFSYMVGYGDSYPQRPASKSAACGGTGNTCTATTWSLDKPNAVELSGALVAGSCSGSYRDQRLLEENSVRLDFNSGFQGVLAALNSPAFKCKDDR